MMFNPQEEAGVPVASVPYAIPPNAPPPDTIPPPFQMNVQPNMYESAPMWTGSPGSPYLVYSAAQPPPPGFQVPAGVNPQVTGQSQIQETFLKGKPKSLGIVLIVMAILQIGFTISLPFITPVSISLHSGIQFWGPIFYIIAGSLSIAAEKGLDLCRIRGSLTFSILSSIFSLIAIILNCLDYSFMSCYYSGYVCYTVAGYIIVSFFLIFNMLVFCVSISISVFGCRALKHVQSNTTTVFVIQNVQPPTFPTSSPVPQGPLPPPYLFQSAEKVGPQ